MKSKMSPISLNTWCQKDSIYKDNDAEYCEPCLTKLLVSKIKVDNLYPEDSIQISRSKKITYEEIRNSLRVDSVKKIDSEYDKNCLMEEHDVLEWSNFDWDYMATYDPKIGDSLRIECPKCKSDLLKRDRPQTQKSSMLCLDQLMSLETGYFKSVEKMLLETGCPECGNFNLYNVWITSCFCKFWSKRYWGCWLKDFEEWKSTNNLLNWYLRRFLISFFFIFFVTLVTVNVVDKVQYLPPSIIETSVLVILKLIVSAIFTLSVGLTLVFSIVFESVLDRNNDAYSSPAAMIHGVVWGLLTFLYPMLWFILAVNYYYSEDSYVITWGLGQIAFVAMAAILLFAIKIAFLILQQCLRWVSTAHLMLRRTFRYNW